MFASIRRHQKWIFIIAMFFVIPAFVVFFSPEIGTGRGGGREDFGTLYGEPISRSAYYNAQRDAMLMFRVNVGEWPGRGGVARQLGFDLETETIRRLVLLRQLEEHRIKVSDEAVVQEIRNLFRDDNRQYDPDIYRGFVKNVLPEVGMSDEDLFRFLRHELGVRQLVSLVGISGKLVTERAAEMVYRRENEQVDTQVIFFSRTNYVDQVEVTEANLAQFYTNQMATYRIPSRVQVSYVEFPATNFLAEAEARLKDLPDLEVRLDQVYESRGTNAFTDAEGKPLPADEAKEKIREELRQEAALVEARKQANEFATVLFDMEPPQAANLEKLAAEKGLTVNESEPFTEFETPKGMDVPPTFGRTAFALNDEEPYALPVVGREAVYVATLKRRVPSEVPPLDQVKERVTADYQRFQSEQLMRNAAGEARKAVANGIAEGKSVSEIAAAAKLEWVDLPPFSRNTRALPELEQKANFPHLQRVALETGTGEISEFTPAGERGFIVHVEQRLPASEEQVKEELPEFVSELRERRQGQAFSEWLNRQLQLASPTTPLGEEQAN